MKKINFIILALVIIAGVTSWQYTVLKTKNQAQPNAQEESVAIDQATTSEEITGDTAVAPIYTIEVLFDFGDENQSTISYPVAENNTNNLFAITQEIAQQENWIFEYTDYGELGKLVSKINNTANGQNKKYWQYFSNSKQPQVSAEKYIPKVDEKIEWRFTESPF